MAPPEPFVKIQNDFTELFLMMHSTKNAQMQSPHGQVKVRENEKVSRSLKSKGIIKVREV